MACTQGNESLLTVNFHRKTLGQTGIGHYSPIGAYNAKRDMALILDVAKFKYDSYWCHLPNLYEALKPLDGVSQISRGFVINKKKIDLGVEDMKENGIRESLFIKKITK
jgi:glutathione gamma-glutamylcysteinyltransferase